MHQMGRAQRDRQSMAVTDMSSRLVLLAGIFNHKQQKKTGSESQLNINLFFKRRIVCFFFFFLLHIHQTWQLCQVPEKRSRQDLQMSFIIIAINSYVSL